jgi:hypothetical protein
MSATLPARSSLVLPPGQFKNQTLEKLANAATKKYGITFSLKGMPEGAQKVFERVSLHWGESPFQFILRLAQMRNIHIMDNELGNIVGIHRQQQVAFKPLPDLRPLQRAADLPVELLDHGRWKILRTGEPRPDRAADVGMAQLDGSRQLPQCRRALSRDAEMALARV